MCTKKLKLSTLDARRKPIVDGLSNDEKICIYFLKLSLNYFDFYINVCSEYKLSIVLEYVLNIFAVIQTNSIVLSCVHDCWQQQNSEHSSTDP